MKIVIDEKRIARNKKIGNYAMIGSLAALGIGLYLTLSPEFSTDPRAFSWTFGLILVGFILSQIGSYNQSRWGKSPRPDEEITAALKGLDDKHTLYHYTSPVPHLLVGPSGLWILLPYTQGGTIRYTDKGWKQSNQNTFKRLFTGDSLGKPENDGASYIATFTRAIKKVLPDAELDCVNAVAVFTHPKVELDVESAPISALQGKKLKDLIRKQIKATNLEQGLIDQINASLQKK